MTLLLERQKCSTLLMYFVVLFLFVLILFIIDVLNTKNNREILINDLESICCRTRNISKENTSIAVGPNFGQVISND